MYAVIETGGKQYRVAPGDLVAVEKVAGAVGTPVDLDRVLLVAEGDRVVVGRPTVAGAKVVSKIVAQTRAPKITVFKFKRRKNYRRKRGHRQALTRLRVTEIVVS